MEFYPGFSLYRGLYEFSQYAFQRNLNGRDGMKWRDFRGSAMEEVFCIIILEWFLALTVTYYMDRVSSSAKDPLVFLQNTFKKSLSPQKLSLQKQESAVSVEMEKLDVIQEVLQKNSQLTPCFFVFRAILMKRNFFKLERNGRAVDA